MSIKLSELNKMDDLQVLELIHSDSPSSSIAMEYFLEKYKSLVLAQARSLFLIGGDREDLLQEGMIGLYKAVREFDPGKECSFNTFANTVVYQQMCNAIAVSNRKKNQPLNEYISFYTPVLNKYDDYESMPLIDTMEASVNSNPEDFIIDKENTNMIEYELGKTLSSFEKSVFSLYVNGMDYKQIATELNRTPKAIDNALQRIRSKLTALLSKVKKD